MFYVIQLITRPSVAGAVLQIGSAPNLTNWVIVFLQNLETLHDSIVRTR